MPDETKNSTPEPDRLLFTWTSCGEARSWETAAAMSTDPIDAGSITAGDCSARKRGYEVSWTQGNKPHGLILPIGSVDEGSMKVEKIETRLPDWKSYSKKLRDAVEGKP